MQNEQNMCACVCVRACMRVCACMCVCVFTLYFCPHMQYEAYLPDEEDREQQARDREEDLRTEQEAVREGRLEVPDYSNQMDTIARFAEHPYHLRSLHRGGVGQQQEGVGQEEIEEQGVWSVMGRSCAVGISVKLIL